MLDFVINAGFYIGIHPIRIIRGIGNVEIKTSRLRRVICGGLQILSVFLYFLIHTYPYLKVEIRKGNQTTVLFITAAMFAELGYVCSVLCIFWFRRKCWQAMVKELGKLEIHKMTRVSRLARTIIGLVLLAAILSIIPYSLYIPPQIISPFRTEILGCPELSHQSYIAKPFTPWIQAIWDDDDCNSVAVKVANVMQLLVYMYFWIQWVFTNSMFFASALLVYRFANQLRGLVKEGGICHHTLMSHYRVAKYRIGLVNQVMTISPFLAVAFFVMLTCQFAPWTVVLDHFNLRVIGYMLLHLLTLAAILLAAEGNRLMGDAGNLIISTFPSSDAANSLVVFDNFPGDCGLKGWSFFTITYPFVGSVGTAVFTFLLVIVQIPNH